MNAENFQCPQCPSDIKIFDQQENIVVLRPSIPTWMTLTREGLSLLKQCTGTLTVKEIADNLKVSTNEVHECIEFLREHKLFGEDEPIEAPTKELYNVWLHVTNACNLKCIICYQSSGRPYTHELTIKEIAELLFQATKFKPQNERQTVILTGGEPLLRSDIWDICLKGSELGYKVGLLTNGTLISEETAQKIKTYTNGVQVSLDGMQKSNDIIRGEGSFKQIIAGISRLLDSGTVPSVAIVATKINLKEIPSLIRFLLDHDIINIQIRPVIYQGRCSGNQPQVAMTGAEYESLITSLYEEGYSSDPHLLKTERFADDIKTPTKNARGCSAGRYSVSIAATGEVYPCIAGHIPQFRLDQFVSTHLRLSGSMQNT